MASTDKEIVVPDEGELAADYLETLLDIADLDGLLGGERSVRDRVADFVLGHRSSPRHGRHDVLGEGIREALQRLALRPAHVIAQERVGGVLVLVACVDLRLEAELVERAS